MPAVLQSVKLRIYFKDHTENTAVREWRIVKPSTPGTATLDDYNTHVDTIVAALSGAANDGLVGAEITKIGVSFVCDGDGGGTGTPCLALDATNPCNLNQFAVVPVYNAATDPRRRFLRRINIPGVDISQFALSATGRKDTLDMGGGAGANIRTLVLGDAVVPELLGLAFRDGVGLGVTTVSPGVLRSKRASMNIAATRRKVAQYIPSRWAIPEKFVCACYFIDRKYRIAQ